MANMMELPVLVSPEDLSKQFTVDPMVIIDTRDADAYAASHIPGAVNLREIFTYLASSSPEGLEDLKKSFSAQLGAIGLSGKETAVFYEDSMNSGYGQSCRGYFLLTWLGYPKIQVLNGGLSAWKAASLPITTEVPTPIAAIFPMSSTGNDVMVTLEDVKEKLGSAAVLMDVRDVDEWIGDSSSP